MLSGMVLELLSCDGNLSTCEVFEETSSAIQAGQTSAAERVLYGCLCDTIRRKAGHSANVTNCLRTIAAPLKWCCAWLSL